MGVTPKQFEQMQKRLGAVRRKPEPSVQSLPSRSLPSGEVIIGVDPSLRGTGFGVVCGDKSGLRALAFGTVACPAGWSRSRCLLRISEALRDVVNEHRPVLCVIEGLFYAQNLQTAIIMGEARGAALAALAAGGLEIFEIAPRKVKQAVVGYGAAQKLAVAKMVQRMLKLSDLPEPDAADALALALAYLQSRSRFGLSTHKRV